MNEKTKPIKMLTDYEAGVYKLVIESVVQNNVSLNTLTATVEKISARAKQGCDLSKEYLADLLNVEEVDCAEDYFGELYYDVALNAYQSIDFGYVYAMYSPAMPGIIKIGMTTRTPAERAKELSAPTSTPIPFKTIFSFQVMKCEAVEQKAHKILAKQRVSNAREFFGCSPAKARASVMQAIQEVYTGMGLRISGGVVADLSELYVDEFESANAVEEFTLMAGSYDRPRGFDEAVKSDSIPEVSDAV